MLKQAQILNAYLVGGMTIISEKLSDADVRAGVQVFILGMADMLRQAENLSWPDFIAIYQSVLEEHKLLPTISVEDFMDNVGEAVSTNEDVAKLMRFGAQSIQMYVGERDAQAPTDLLSVPQFVEGGRSSFSQLATTRSPTAAAGLDLDGAEKQAIRYLRAKGRSDTTVKARDLPPPGAYGLNPDGWVTFCVIERFPRGVGGDEFVAVNLSTGEVQSLGTIGD